MERNLYIHCSKDVPLLREKGSAFIELTVVSIILLFLLGVALEFGFTFFVYQALQRSVREGARIAATLPSLTADDSRVENEILARLNKAQFSLYSANFSVTNTAPTSKEGLTNSSGLACDKEVTVAATAVVSFLILRTVGYSSMPLKRNVTMRYQIQPICQ